MSKSLKNSIVYGLGLALGGTLLYLALRKADFAELWTMLSHASWLPLIGALTFVTLAHLLRAWRWTQLLSASGHPVPVNRTFAALMFGYMVNYAVPRLGEVTRCSILIKTNRTPLATSAGTVVTERVVDVLTLGLCIGLVLLLELKTLAGFFEVAHNPLESLNYTALAIIALCLVVAVLVTFRFRKRLLQIKLFAKIAGFLQQLVQGLLSIRHLKQPVGFIALSLLIWVGYIASMWCFMLAFEHTAHTGLWMAVILNTMGAIGMTLPVPGGLGPFHAAITYTLVLYGFSEMQGANLALVMHTSQLILNILMGAAGYAYLLFRQPSAQEIARSEAASAARV